MMQNEDAAICTMYESTSPVKSFPAGFVGMPQHVGILSAKNSRCVSSMKDTVGQQRHHSECWQEHLGLIM